MNIQPQVNTERFSAEPKIITERIVGEPQVVTEELLEPVRQRIEIQPQINQRVERLIPVFQRQKENVQLRQEMLPVQSTSE